MPGSFGYKCAWFAAKSDSPLSVATALGLRNLRPSSWDEGIETAYGTTAYSRHAFLAPPIDGWVLCASTAFFKLAEGKQEVSSFLPALSRQLGAEVQYFLTHRVIEMHIWGLAKNGELIRLYGFIGERGETLFDVDDRSPDASDPKANYWAREDLTFPNEDHVMQLAGRWSIDPTTLEGRELTDGWVGGLGG